MEKYIAVTKENREFLIKTFRTTKMAVWRALTFVERGGDSPRARNIRHLAQQRGGIFMIASPAIETMHDADGYMRQYFPIGVMLECDKNTGRVDIIIDGKSVKNYQHVMLDQFPAIQAEAQSM